MPQYFSAPPTLTNGQQVAELCDSGGRRLVAASLVDSAGALIATGPTDDKRLPASANSNNATVVKASPGRVYQLNGLNATAGVKYLKLYNKATAPAPGTDNALLIGVYALAASAPFSISLSQFGQTFSAGLGFALVTGSSDTDNTSVAANDILGLNILYA